MKLRLSFIAACGMLSIFSSCALFKPTEVVYEIDPVCHMKVDKSEAFIYTYNGTKYYFDNVNCKETFKMSPENILNGNKCMQQQK